MHCATYTRVSLDRTGEALAVARQEQECRAAAAVEAALPAAVPVDLIGADAHQVWVGLSMDVKRAAVDTLVMVMILPAGSGKAFDPDTVQVLWRS